MTQRLPIPRLAVLLSGALAVAAIVSSCADPVHDQLIASLGPEDPNIPQGEYHRAGQPCTACHGPEGPAKTEFSLAGTIFWSGGVAANSGSVVGVNGATVSVEDSLGVPMHIPTNCVGNFFVPASKYTPAFPILVAAYAGHENLYTAKMLTQISRATSCAECHFDPVNYNAPGHIFLTGGAPPADQLAANANCPVNPNLADSPSAGLPVKLDARLLADVAVALAIGSGIVVVASCGGTPDPNRYTNIYTPDDAFEQFAGGGAKIGVNGFLSARCGTLDCHGQIGRPLRIFSQNGLRIVDDAGDYPGGAPSTEAEILANFTAAISAQPELTSEVFAGNYDPHVLLLLRKPLQLERHKGGQVLQADDTGDTCLTSWLSGHAVDYAACGNAASVP